MQRLSRQVEEHNIYRWAANFLAALAAERMAGTETTGIGKALAFISLRRLVIMPASANQGHHTLYKLLRALLFRLPPETSHYLTFTLLRLFYRLPGAGTLTRFLFARRQAVLPVTVMGLKFSNPVGLAAGLDKNADGSLTMTKTRYKVVINITLPTPTTIADSGTYTATSTSITQNSQVQPVQSTGTWTQSGHLFTIDVTAVGNRIISTWQKQ